LRAIVVCVASSKQRKEQAMSNAIGRTRGGRNPRVMMAIAALAVVLLALTVVAVFQTAPTPSHGSVNPAIRADGRGGSSIAQDPYIERHTEVVARHHGVIPH
jgi:hypothetical protein